MAPAQEVQPILAPIMLGPQAGISSTAISRVTPVNCGGGGTPSFTYTCQSSSNRLIIVAQSNGSTPSLSDTDGLASSATTLFSLSVYSATIAWNMACASGSNVITVTTHGSGGTPQACLVEYSGIQNGGDGYNYGVSGTSGTSGTCTPSSFSTRNTGDLSVAWVSMNNVNGYAGGATGYTPMFPYANQIAVEWLDNLSAASGAIQPTFGWNTVSSSQPACYVFNVPGIQAPSPGYYPTVYQARGSSFNSTTGSVAYLYNVVSGDVLTVTVVSGNSTTPSITDSLSTSFSLATSNTVGSLHTYIFTGKATSSGADTVTQGTAISTDFCMTIGEIAGGLAGTVTNTGGPTASASNMSWNQTVSNANSVVVASIGGTGSYSDTGLANPLSWIQYEGNIDYSCATAWAPVYASGSQSISITSSNSGGNGGASIVLQ